MRLGPLFCCIIFHLFICLPGSLSAQWTQLNTGATDDLYAVDYLSSGHVWIGTYNGVLRSSNNGTSFSPSAALDATLGNAAVIGSFEAIHAFGPSSAIATGMYFLGNDLIIYSTTNGTNWTHAYYSGTGGLPRFVQAMAFGNGGTAVAAGTNGRTFYSTNNGSSWTSVTQISLSLLEDVAWAGGNTFVTIASNAIFRSTNGGQSWTNLNFPSPNFKKLSFAPGTGTGYLINGNNILRSTDAGLTWTTVGNVSGQLTAIHCVSPDTLYLGSTTDLYRSVSGGQYWEAFHPTNFQPITMIDFYDNDHGIAVGENGYALGTSNAGAAAYPVSSFSLPSGPYCQNTSVQLTAAIDPAWSRQWLLNGVPVSTALNPQIMLNTSGTAIIALVTTNGSLSDTLEQTIQVTPDPVVLPFTVKRDTVCYNAPATFKILNSQVATFYGIYDGTTYLGGQNGNGGMITLSTTSNQTLVKPLRIKASITNACGTDSLSVIDSVFMVLPGANVTAAYYRDTVCVNDTTTMLIFNSQPGWMYYLNSNPSVTVAGNGGTIGIPVPATTNNITHYVTTYIPGFNCYRQVGGGYLLVQLDAYATILPGTLQAGVNQPVNLTVSPVLYNVFAWDFGPNATPSVASGQNVGPVTFSTQGIDTITLYAQLNNTCFQTIKKPVYVYGIPAAAGLVNCQVDSGALFGTTTITRFEMDEYNNLIIAAYNYSSGAFKFTPTITRLDTTGDRRFYHSLQTIGNSPGMQGLISGIAGDRLGNTFMGVHMTALRYWDIQGKYMRHPNVLVKLDPSGKFEWAVESPYAEFSDVIATPDNRIYAIGGRAYNGFSMQTPQGAFEYKANVNNKGDAFLIEVAQNGAVKMHSVFGGLGTNGTQGAAPLKINYAINSPIFDFDTLRANLRMRLMNNGKLRLCGLIGAQQNLKPVYFGGDQLVNAPAYGGQTWSGLYISTFDTTTGFSQSNVVMRGNPTFITDFTTDVNGNTFIVGKATNLITTSAGSVTLTPANAVWNYAASFSPAGNLNWIIYSDSMEYKSIHVNADGTAGIGVAMTSKFLLVDYTSVPYNLSPTKQAGTFLIRVSPTGEILNADRVANQTAAAIKQDACGNYHVIYSFGSKTVRSVFSPAGNCSANCYAAYDPSRKDLGIASFAISDTSAMSPAQRLLTARLVNRAPQPVTSIDFVYSINGGTMQNTSWNGQLNPGDSLLLSLGTVNLNRVSNIIAGWIGAVNGSGDAEQSNDTAVIRQIVCQGGLSGTYSLGCDTCYFESFSAATKAMNRCGISGNVRFEAEPGYYYDQVIIDSIIGAGPADTVVFTSRTGNAQDVTLDFQPDYSYYKNTVYLNRADYISLTHLHISNTAPSPYGAMIIESGSRSTVLMQHNENVNIADNIIDGPLTSYGAGGVASPIYFFVANDFSFERNKVNGGFGISGNGVSAVRNENIVFADNEIRNCGGLFMNRMHGLRFTNNRLLYSSDVLFMDCDSVVIANNLISLENLRWATALTLLNIDGTATSPSLFYNNSVGNNSITFNYPSLEMNQCDYLNLYHNSFNSGVTLYSASNSINFKNNVVRANDTFVLESNSTFDFNQVDNNRYVSSGAPLNFIWNGNQNLNLAQWRATSGFDLNSDSVNVTFVSHTDMHLLNALSMPVPSLGITTDIDGETRSAVTATSGADEFSLNSSISIVWPGDCDSSGTVDNYDIIPIGLNYQKYETTRAGMSAAWSAQPSLLWTEQQGTGINVNHADANGDGIILKDDTLAVTQNMGLTHPFAAQDIQRPQTGPDLTLLPNASFYADDDTVQLDVMVGSQLMGVNDMAAVGYQVQIPFGLIKPGTFETIADSSFVCPDGNCIQFNKADITNGVASFSFARFDGVGVNGTGRLGMIRFVKNPAYVGPTSIPVSFLNYQAYEPDAAQHPLTLQPTILNVTTGLKNISSETGVYAFPNPAGGNITVRALWKGEQQSGVMKMLDLSGRQVGEMQPLELFPGTNEFRMDLSTLQPGVFVLVMETINKRIVTRVVHY